MNRFICLVFIMLPLFLLLSQESHLPKDFTPTEKQKMDSYLTNLVISSDVITDPPSFEIRAMAEWEEIQCITIAWEGFEPILTEIVRNSVDQCKVIIACSDPVDVEMYLENNQVETSNIEYLDITTNSIWMRDYGQNTIYKDDVDSLFGNFSVLAFNWKNLCFFRANLRCFMRSMR